MTTLQPNQAVVNPYLEPPAPLSYADGYVYRGVWFSRFGKGRFPNATTFNAGQLLMKVNGFRDTDGRTPIGERQLRRTLSSLRDKGYIAFRANRRRRKPTAGSFQRATFVECLVIIEAIRYLERGRHQNMTHLLPRTVKCPLAATPRKKAVHGHEVTNSPLEVTKKGKERASSNGVAKIKAEPAVKAPALVPSDSQDPQTQHRDQRQKQKRPDGESLADIEARLDKRAVELGAAPTHPKPGRRFEIRDALARGHTADELEELVERAVADRWAKKQNFWGDVVAHASKHAEKYQARGRVERWWLSDVELEAAIGARAEGGGGEGENRRAPYGPEGAEKSPSENREEPVEADHDRTKPVEETVEEVAPRISWPEFLRRHPS